MAICAERTRRLILIGTVIIAKAEKEEDFKACLMKWLDGRIIAERDRALFDLVQPEKDIESCQLQETQMR